MLIVCPLTPVTNTGWLKGVCTLIELWRGNALLWMACHHIYELHLKVNIEKS